ncbi:hypothetical protein KIN20_020509 [Parelaphostrongylus tenuis]|uniref:Methyltransferase domain-containing protein n=1 Tax=Parelaphostrongylus tenuis TaxID=148309 RepID=A0AAD5MSY1_PARTN|nr:hypothetical protein KIN20_010716 [Parelaphostrongylus tenuis]KAJ1361293.1 hypothetical protein KIN20_020509 [Parelaphostrongylus tenuis]
MKGSLSMTSAYLKLPKKLVKSELDTRKWKVDFDIAPYGPSRTMANEIFANGSISRANTSNTHVLVLGLGGGLLSGYLHQNFPQMKITAVDISPTVVSMAKKWFSLEPDERYQVVVEDGVQYLRRSVQQGLRFDAIVLDACFMESELDLTCPAKVFLSDEPIENMATLLGQRGVLTVNFLYRSKIAKDKALEKFHKFFKYDKEVDLRPFRNYVHTFTQFEAPRSREDKTMERSFA